MSRLQSNGFVRIRFIFRLIVILWACALPLQSVEFGVVFGDIVRVEILYINLILNLFIKSYIILKQQQLLELETLLSDSTTYMSMIEVRKLKIMIGAVCIDMMSPNHSELNNFRF